MKKQSIAELYRSRKVEAEAVEVTLPSGCVFRMRRPSVLKMVLGNGLPLSLAAEMQAGGGAEPSPADVAQIEEMIRRLRRLLGDLSVEPRIVFEPTASPDELFIDEIEDADLEYLVAWVSNGGDEGAPALRDFRPRQGADALAGARRPGLRVAAKRPARGR